MIRFLVCCISFVTVLNVGAFSTCRSLAVPHKSSSLFLNLEGFFSNLNPNRVSKTTVIAGATGYIGKATVRESVRQGYNTIALVRDVKKIQSEEGKLLYGRFFEGAKLVEADVCDLDALKGVSYEFFGFYSYTCIRNIKHSMSHPSLRSWLRFQKKIMVLKR